MPVRPMTDEEADEIFGGGMLIFGQRKPTARSATVSLRSSPPESFMHEPERESLPRDTVDGPPATAQQENLDQQAHDQRMSQMTSEDIRRLARGLGDLMRAKMKSESSEGDDSL